MRYITIDKRDRRLLRKQVFGAKRNLLLPFIFFLLKSNCSALVCSSQRFRICAFCFKGECQRPFLGKTFCSERLQIRHFAKKKSDDGVDESEADDSSQENASNNSKPLQKQTQSPSKSNGNILNLLSNPFKAGKALRETFDSALNTFGVPSESRTTYLDDRFLESATPSQGAAFAFAERSQLFDRFDTGGDGYIPEVLVIGSTGEIGRLVVRRLVRDGVRVRVLVRDLYSSTLNLLGAEVTYCRGDLNNLESLEYAVTDVDKIVFCAGAPRRDEDDFQTKFQDFVNENLHAKDGIDDEEEEEEENQFQKFSDLVEVRANLAEQVDRVGMQNLVRAYQNVRHADYGTSQAAKRSLFKFQDREEDFGLFSIDNDDSDELPIEESFNENMYDLENDIDETYIKRTASKAQISWKKNQFDHGVFFGRVPAALSTGSTEAAVVSSRLRSRENPEKGIDLSAGFSGFVCRLCSDGKDYEAFIRTTEYHTDGVEYVCKFSTRAKTLQKKNKSRNKFVTVRLPFHNFVPVARKSAVSEERMGKRFVGADVQQIGFRFCSTDNRKQNPNEMIKRKKDWINFYLALCYIKVYRSQPEPEFVYLSDAKIPPVVSSAMVRHDLRKILLTPVDSLDEGANTATIFDEKEAQKMLTNAKDRSGEETYFKFCGEEILKHSGLSYAIIRIAGLNESPSGEFSTVTIKQSNKDLTPVSRAEVADVCVSALLNPNARNTCFYMTKAKPGERSLDIDEKTSTQFVTLKPET